MTAETAQRWGSALDEVVVYAQGAVCRRLARGTVPPDGRVRVTGLPRSLDPGSLRARVSGSGAVSVVEARLEVEAEPLDAADSDALRREVELRRDEWAAAQGRRDRQLGLIEEVGAVRPVPPARRREDPHRRTPVDAWLGLADFVDERLTSLHTRLAELEEALERAEHAFLVASDRLDRASTDAPPAQVRTTVSAVLTFGALVDPTPAGARAGAAAEPEGELEVEIEYAVPGAVWAPAYRLTHRRGEDSGRLVLRASVAQRTGEDWTGVRIALATADLRRRTDLPRLRSMRIGRRQPSPAPSGWREPPAGLADLFAGYDAAGTRPDGVEAPMARAMAKGRGEPVLVGSAGPPAGHGESADHDGFAGYGAPPPPPLAGGPAPAASFGPGGGARQRGGMMPAAPAAMVPTASGRPMAPRSAAPAAPGSAVPPPTPPTGPPRPSGDELDYPALVLSGPEEQGGRRGRLFPDVPYDPVAAEYRRRAEAVAALPLPGHAVPPRVSAGSFDHRFDAIARTDIPSDGAWHTVTVGEIPVDLRTEYLCVPSVEQTVYGTLVLSHSTGQALLAGPVEVVVGDDFLLTAALPTLAPGGVCRVGLGPAEGIGVTRRTTVHESTSGLRNSTTVLDHRVHVELANRLAGPVTVEVRERVPVTSDADVRIEERADWSAPRDDTGTEHHTPGTRVWRVDLPAGGATALDGGYEIRIPSAKALAGGNRRS
ncbi:DUF4139 domain-containing protein [Streptomyces hilarionis]|uniref:DUF4139 domain-containing protein n=1 Tax=Streptomyces hilarionis TaxID=2839954 RepID=UPI00211A34EC|nr:DUF4139 domain-containing protein [Streptomyces hilarionis]MCQ9129527.1 DUF4139 domain-containing protein [Streptomyces hilarionis]